MKGKVIYVDFNRKQAKVPSKPLNLLQKIKHTFKKTLKIFFHKQNDNVIYPFRKIL